MATMPDSLLENAIDDIETDWLDWLHHRRPDRATGDASIAGQEGEPHDNT